MSTCRWRKRAAIPWTARSSRTFLLPIRVPFPAGTWHGSVTAAAAPFIWIADLKSLDIEKVPRTDSNDFNPMSVNSTVYFLSDRDGLTTLFAYDLKTKKVERVLEPTDSDIKSAAACADAIAFARINGVFVFDLKDNKTRKLDIQVRGDLPGVRPR